MWQVVTTWRVTNYILTLYIYIYMTSIGYPIAKCVAAAFFIPVAQVVCEWYIESLLWDNLLFF